MISPIAGQMPSLIGYRLSVAIASLFLVGGGLLYTFATNGWMVFMARFLMGIFDGCAYIFSYSYLSNIGNKLEKVRQADRDLKQSEALEESRSKCCRRMNSSDNTVKDTLFTVSLLIKSIMYPIAFGKLKTMDDYFDYNNIIIHTAVTTIMVQFRELNQYRWPGWFVAIVGVVYCGAFVVFVRPERKQSKIIREEESSKDKKGNVCSTSRQLCSTVSCRAISPPKCKEVIVSSWSLTVLYQQNENECAWNFAIYYGKGSGKVLSIIKELNSVP